MSLRGVSRPALIRILWLLPVILGVGLITGGNGGEEVVAPHPVAWLQLQDGGVIAGRLHNSSPFGVVSWQGGDFAGPFEFPFASLNRIQFPPHPSTDEKEKILFQLASGDLISGELKSWSERMIEINSPELGPMHIRTASLKRIFRAGKSSIANFPQLDGLSHWSGKKSNWTEEGFALSTSASNAMLGRDLKIPEKAEIEFELSWEKEPNFLFTLASQKPTSQKAEETGWRIECWSDKFVLVREEKKIADLCPISGVDPASRRLHLVACLDQSRGEISLLHPDGTPAAALKLPGSKSGTAIQLANFWGNVRLERLSVLPWSGRFHDHSSGTDPQFELADGSSFSGLITAVTESKGDLIFQLGQESRQIPLKELNSILFAPVPDIAERSVGIALQNGDHLSGIVQQIRENRLLLITPDLDRTLSIPIENLLTVSRERSASSGTPIASASAEAGRQIGKIQLPDPNLSPEKRARRKASQTRKQDAADAPQANANAPNRRLVVRNGVVVRESPPPTAEPEPDIAPDMLQHSGQLLDAGQAAPGIGCLVWKPVGSRTASPLKAGSFGTICFEKPRPSAASEEPAGNQQGRGFANLFLKKVEQLPQASTKPVPRHSLHLRTGDVIPCSLLAIDDRGVLISSPVVDEQLIPHARIKALELIPEARVPSLQDAKKERLLTLPRFQKASPPTHLLCSKTGDFLRCRVLSLNKDLLNVEVQLEELSLPLNRVAQIIWFHPDEMPAKAPEGGSAQTSSQSAPAEAVSENPESAATLHTGEQETADDPDHSLANQIQVLTENGKRATFTPRAVRGGVIQGVSDVVGECRFELSQLDRIIIGAEISAVAVQLPFQQWKLQPSVEPLVAQDLGNDDGTSSPLVGKPAPKLDLELLGGGRFSLAGQKGRIIVLDFWATWCGPCIQTIPLMEGMMQEFPPEQVQLISVNLEEPAQQIQAVLERHRFHLTVALDRDGVAAHRYQATAIPQVVVVNGQGIVTHVFVGGGPNMVQLLKTALQAELAAGSPGQQSPQPQ